jgi:hypothetical protein
MNIKTIFILLILLIPISYSFKKLFQMFTKKDGYCNCAGCPSAKKNQCSSKSKKI